MTATATTAMAKTTTVMMKYSTGIPAFELAAAEVAELT
jgi:hypothetical protein